MDAADSRAAVSTSAPSRRRRPSRWEQRKRSRAVDKPNMLEQIESLELELQMVQSHVARLLEPSLPGGGFNLSESGQ